MSAPAEQQRRREEAAKQGAASMLFLEMLFWKPASLAAEIRDEYNWRVRCRSLDVHVTWRLR